MHGFKFLKNSSLIIIPKSFSGTILVEIKATVPADFSFGYAIVQGICQTKLGHITGLYLDVNCSL